MGEDGRENCPLDEKRAYVWAGFRTIGPSGSTAIGAPTVARERGHVGAGGAPQEPRGVAFGCHAIRPNPNFRAHARHFFVLAFAMGRKATPCSFRYGGRPRAPFRGRKGPRRPKAMEPLCSMVAAPQLKFCQFLRKRILCAYRAWARHQRAPMRLPPRRWPRRGASTTWEGWGRVPLGRCGARGRVVAASCRADFADLRAVF